MTERRAAIAPTAYAALTVLVAACAAATPPEATMDPYSPIPQAEGVITVGIEDFAHLPDSDQGLGELIPARMMLLRDEPSTGRLFVNDLNGLLYSVSYEGKATPYLELNAERWNLELELAGTTAAGPDQTCCLRIPKRPRRVVSVRGVRSARSVAGIQPAKKPPARREPACRSHHKHCHLS